MKTITLLLMTFLVIASFLAGCAEKSPEAPTVVTSAVSELPAAEPIRVAPSLTPVVTTAPENEAAAPTESVPSPTPMEEGRVDIAQGFCYFELNDEIKERITGISYPEPGEPCKISCDELRYIKLLHYNFDGNVLEGELIVNKALAQEVTQIFYELYKARYALTSVKLVDDFGQKADDTLSMEANNTSAFCYRYVTGTKKLSRHSYGAAIDINPLLNPYIDGNRVAPVNGAEYVDRSKDFPEKIDHDDLCYRLFKEYGWEWGGDWKGDKDYQHFSKALD